MGRYVGSCQTHQVNFLSPPVPEAADGQLTAGVALSIRAFLTPNGVGNRSIELRTRDRFGRDLGSTIQSLTIGSEAKQPSALARAAIYAAAKRESIPEADIGKYPVSLSSLPALDVRVISADRDI